MSGLSDIAVVVQGERDAPTGQVDAILYQIEAMLAQLAGGTSDSIDLRSLPLSDGDYQALVDALGRGEVKATINALGPTEIQETAFAGVWWVTHYNAENEIMGQFIEITLCPRILSTHLDEVEEARQRLRDVAEQKRDANVQPTS